MKRFMLCSAIVLPMIALLAQVGSQAQDKKDSPWKPILPAESYQELTERSIKAIEAAAKANGKDARDRVDVEAAILAGYTLCAKDPSADRVAKLRGQATGATKADLAKLTSSMLPPTARQGGRRKSRTVRM